MGAEALGSYFYWIPGDLIMAVYSFMTNAWHVFIWSSELNFLFKGATEGFASACHDFPAVSVEQATRR